MEQQNAWTALCSKGEGMVPYTVRLLTLVWTEVPEVKSQVCENLSEYLQKCKKKCQFSRGNLAEIVTMLENCIKSNLVHTTVDNFLDVMRSEIFSLRELCFAILQHIDNAITLRKTPPNVHTNQIQQAPHAHASTLKWSPEMQERTMKIENGWDYSMRKNRLHTSGIGTFSLDGATYPNAMVTPRWHMRAY